MAHSLGILFVAEGVETAARQQFMRAAGCDIMQGYYFARPMPAAQLTALLQEHAAQQPVCAA
jgi:EAL domain-containing protein (putative c-di-GMP-specific phosphodiesterase class I)